jgi:hypothetical protein
MITTRALRLPRQSRRSEALDYLRDAGGCQAAVNLLLTGQDWAAVTVLEGQERRDMAAAAQGASPEAVRAPGGGVRA